MTVNPRPDGVQRSLTSWILNRGLRVVVLHPDDADGTTLTGHLMRMGFQVQAFWPPPDELPDKVDLVFRALLLDAREPQDAWQGPASPPLISVIGYESPSFIDQALKMGADAVLTTPIRATGLLATIVCALQHAKRQRQQADRIAKLEQKLAGTRHLAQAKAILMRMHGIGENDAYEMLRTQAMSNRVTVDDICHSIIQTCEMFEPKRREAG
jgi:AmiR/NasT family two-component response regulator